MPAAFAWRLVRRRRLGWSGFDEEDGIARYGLAVGRVNRGRDAKQEPAGAYSESNGLRTPRPPRFKTWV
jgi:hypothetical protein